MNMTQLRLLYQSLCTLHDELDSEEGFNEWAFDHFIDNGYDFEMKEESKEMYSEEIELTSLFNKTIKQFAERG